MANIKLVREESASDEVKDIYRDIKATMGWDFVPETFQMVAHDVSHLRSYWERYKRVMTPGKVDLRTKKLIAFVVSSINNCGA